MAEFFGSLQGARGEATRLGTKNSGLTTVAASWAGCIRTYLTYDQVTGKHGFEVVITKWQGNGPTPRVLARGVFEDEPSA